MSDPYASCVISNLRFENTAYRLLDDVWSVLGDGWTAISQPSLVINTTSPLAGMASLELAGNNSNRAVVRPSKGFDFTALEDFTAECKIRMSTAQTASGVGAQVMGTWYSNLGWSFTISSTGVLTWRSKATTLNGSGTLAVGTVYYLAYSRKNGIGYLLVNGAVVASGADTQDLTVNSNLWLGMGNSGTPTVGVFNGTLDEVRITRGVGRYDNAGYTPADLEVITYANLARQEGLGVYKPKMTTASPPAQITPSNPQAGRGNAFDPTNRRLTNYQYIQSPLPFVPVAGRSTISGVVTIQGTVAARKVRLYNKQTGQIVREQMSAANGFYTFLNLDPTFEYFAVAHDYTRTFNAVIQDMIQP